MVSFSNTLSIAISGLNAANARAQTVAQNIANAGTEGYTRRVTVLDERTVGRDGAGVQVLGDVSTRNSLLTTERMRLDADSAFANERASAAAQLTSALGEPGSEQGLFGAYVNFETALRDAAATPESELLQDDLLDRGRALTQMFQDLSSAADTQRSDADLAINTAINEVNETLVRLEEFNQLAESEVTPAVQDEQQRLVDRINELIPVSVRPLGNGGISLMTEGGVFLLTESAREIEFSPQANIGRTQTLGNPLSGLTVNGVDITPGGGGSQASRSGEVAALFDTRDTLVPEYQDRLDGLAADIINRFADDTVDPTKTAGESGLFTNGTTTPPGLTNVTGTASSIQLNALIDPQQGGEAYRIRDGVGAVTEGAAGNGDQLNRLIDAFTGARTAPDALGVSGARSAAELAADVASEVSFDDRNRSEAADFALTRLDIASSNELSAVGVDTDQELQQLLVIEQAYAANARVIQTVNQLLDDLLGIV